MENRLKWFDHVIRRPVDVQRRLEDWRMNKIVKITGRPKKILINAIENDTRFLEIEENIMRTMWRKIYGLSMR
ncbi:hypothetical protein OROMI_013488 [Orobanche minor]